MRYVVGITLDRRDRDAVSLALTLARSVVAPHSVAIELVHVIRGPQPDHAQSAQEREFQQLRKDSALEGLAKVSDLIPKSIRSTVTVHFAESMAEGLLEIASTAPCDLIIVGAASRGPFRRFTVGSVANALLHSASVPVALAPSGYLPPSRLTRLTCAMGTRVGADAVLDVSVSSSVRHDVPLRLISLIGLDASPNTPDGRSPADHARALLLSASQQVDDAVEVMVDVAHGRSVDSAVERLSWDDSEIVIIGSSRLAQPKSLFLGATANKMLRSIPVPMVVVPRYPVGYDKNSNTLAL
ncbi:universal stress protein [Brevibacterium sediminis]|uniref:universal stress protein n=1 Tax=Brevibacterium sediminis TaxID=1857024 RepID=UPI0021751E11|nr:universal stress protein [Brevibacterium sediminis]MCS4594782.1 universal stress protein [Brevibacterium sediminis]